MHSASGVRCISWHFDRSFPAHAHPMQCENKTYIIHHRASSTSCAAHILLNVVASTTTFSYGHLDAVNASTSI